MHGLEIYDASGKVVLEIKDRLTRVTATIEIPAGNSGSHTIQGSGTPFYTIVTSLRPPWTGRAAVFRLNGSIVSWTAGTINTTLLVGRY